MNRLKFGILALLFVSLWMSCQKESVELDYDPAILEKWSFTTDDFVSWSEIYDRYMPAVRTAKTGTSGKSIRPALEYEADIVNQITASEQMNEELITISTEIGLPDWSYLMAFESNSIHEDFELFVPLKNDTEITGVLTFTLSDNGMVIRSTKRNTLDHLVRRDVERSKVLEQTQTVAAFNVFEILTYENETPRYEYWFDEVFSEGFDQVSNAKGYDEFHTYWTYRPPNEGTGIVAREHMWTSRVDCPAPTDVEDPFGGGSIGASYWDAIDFRDPRSNGTESTISTTTYIDLSEHKPLAAEEIIIDNATTPCVKDIIKKIKDNQFGSKLFVQVLRDIFDTNGEFNITILEDNLSSNQDAYWEGQGNTATPANLLSGYLTINSDYTSTASQDWILATIIHEMIHAYIEAQRYFVQRGVLSQNEFDRMFPLYKEGSNDPDHTQMAYKYIDVIADILQENNANLSRYEALSLSRVGLLGNPFFRRSLNQEEQDDSTKANEIGRGMPPTTTPNSSTITKATSTQINC